ncbi:MAG: YqgE/AlgH family protein [Bacteroides sp.]|nr:YqgE/AlgH family protein [Bacteroides sp.]
MEVEDFLSNHTYETNPGKGMLLISAPMMLDKYFTRSVVLLINSKEEGEPLGLILNHSIDVNLDQLIEDFPIKQDIKVFNGGPVDLTKMFVLHHFADVKDSIEVLPGLFAGGNSDQLWNHITSGKDLNGKIRFFFGISGWGEDQLTKELLENSWAINPNPNPDMLLIGEGEEYWRREVIGLGENFRSWLSIPIHPSFN